MVFGCVLDWDFDKKLVHVSLNPELVAQRKAAGSQKTKEKKVSTLNFVTFSLNVCSCFCRSLSDLLNFKSVFGFILQLKSGREVQACVQLIKDNYIVVMLPQQNYRLAYAPTKLVAIHLTCSYV